MNGVDLAVLSALYEIGWQLGPGERPVIALPMVVLDLQVAVRQQAVRDDQVVRLVAPGPGGRQRPQGRPRVNYQRQNQRPGTHGPAGRTRGCRALRVLRALSERERAEGSERRESTGPAQILRDADCDPC